MGVEPVYSHNPPCSFSKGFHPKMSILILRVEMIDGGLRFKTHQPQPLQPRPPP